MCPVRIRKWESYDPNRVHWILELGHLMIEALEWLLWDVTQGRAEWEELLVLKTFSNKFLLRRAWSRAWVALQKREPLPPGSPQWSEGRRQQA